MYMYVNHISSNNILYEFEIHCEKYVKITREKVIKNINFKINCLKNSYPRY